ncbi:hypothetical protein [Brevundimonas vesicularis]|jgi:hypothetical protein|uniref:hypothetical protein n=1 Tax=Brevundimonas vesicularis TaxID=41276 RepID=UPI00384A5A40
MNLTSTLTAFTAMSDADVGIALGFHGRTAKNRGAFAKHVSGEILSIPLGGRWQVIDLKPKQVEALDALIAHVPSVMDRLEHYLPRAAALKVLVEQKLGGKITAARLSEANEVWSALVSDLVKPRLRRFLRGTLSFDESGQTTISLEDLIDVLTGPYGDFMKKQAAGFISFVGGYNELLVREALINRGLSASMVQTGTGGAGDIVIKPTAAKATANLTVEVKSYAARERLLRGLQDCQPPKIGVGFFNNAGEFNPNRTTALLQTQALAIYMPEQTLAKLNPAVLDRMNTENGLFYRPLGMLADDVAAFLTAGSSAFGLFRERL